MVRSSCESRSREDESYLMSKTVYTIYIGGVEKHTDISETDFLDLMSDYAQSFYEISYPDPSTISHTMKEING